MFRDVTYPLLTPIIAVVMTFSVLFTFTDFQLIKVLTNGGPAGATELMATMSLQHRDPGRAHRRGRGDLHRDGARSCSPRSWSRWFGLQRRKWQQGEAMTEPRAAVAAVVDRRQRGHELPVNAAAAAGDASTCR